MIFVVIGVLFLITAIVSFFSFIFTFTWSLFLASVANLLLAIAFFQIQSMRSQIRILKRENYNLEKRMRYELNNLKSEVVLQGET